MLHDDLTKGPCINLPTFLALVGMRFEQVFVWLEVRQRCQVAGVAAPAQEHKNIWEEVDDFPSWVKLSVTVIDDVWFYLLFREECTLLEKITLLSITCRALWENQQWC